MEITTEQALELLSVKLDSMSKDQVIDLLISTTAELVQVKEDLATISGRK